MCGRALGAYRKPNLPVAARLAIIGAILNFAFGKPAMRLVCCAAGFLTVSALWHLVVYMM